MRRFRETGSVAAKPMAGDHRLLRTDGRDWRLKREAGELDLTIEELRDKLKARGVIVGGNSSRSCCSQKDKDARWTKKNDESFYGYKNHLGVDRAHKLIRKWDATHAAVHDSQKLDDLLDLSNTGNGVWADSAYRDRQAALNQALNSITRALQLDEQAYQQERLQIINSPYYGS